MRSGSNHCAAENMAQSKNRLGSSEIMWKHIRQTEEVNMEEILGIIRQYLTAINQRRLIA